MYLEQLDYKCVISCVCTEKAMKVRENSMHSENPMKDTN